MRAAYVSAVRLPKEIIVLLVLLVVMIAGVSWYVVDRRAKMREIFEKTEEQLKPILTAEQLAKYKEEREKHRAERANRGNRQ